MPESFRNPLSERMTTIIEQGCATFAKQQNRNTIYLKDLLLSIFEDPTGIAYKVLEVAGVDIDELKKDISSIKVEKDSSKNKVSMHPHAKYILERADSWASKLNHNVIGTEHVILGVLSYTGKMPEIRQYVDIFHKYDIKSKQFQEAIINYLSSGETNISYENASKTGSLSKDDKELGKLSNFLKNINKSVLESDEKFIGREKELDRLSSILARKKKNNALIVGEEGVGKTSLVEGFARKIIEGDVPSNLKDTVLFSLDLSGLVAGTKFRGQFEERMKHVVNFFKDENNSKEINNVLFIDEIHQIISAGSAEGAIDASAMLKPELSSGSFQCIGATTMKEYKKYILKDGPLARRFSTIFLEEPSVENTIEILKGVKQEYEEYHNVLIKDDIIKKTVILCDRYLTNRRFPDKAIDVLDESCVQKVMEKTKDGNFDVIEKKIFDTRKELEQKTNDHEFEKCSELVKKRDNLIKSLNDLKNSPIELDEETVTKVISTTTGIPLGHNSKEEQRRLVKMTNEISKVVVNQKEAIEQISNAVQRARAGLKDPRKPAGTFLFLGETGCGKTLLAKELAKYLFGSEDKLIRLDMSEYMEKFAVTKIIGSPPGYVGYDDSGRLVDIVKTKPYSVILLDEIGKAHPDVWNVFLQVFDEGRLTESSGGETIDFKNTIIIMTSNIGVDKLMQKSMGFLSENKEQEQKDKEKKHTLIGEVKKKFSPELFNRIDEVIVFNSLDEGTINRIFEIESNKVEERLKERRISIEFTESASQFLTKRGYDEKYGARPMRRAIQKYVENELAIKIISEEIKSNCSVKIDYKKEEEKLSFTSQDK